MRILVIAPFLPDPQAGHAGSVVLWRMVQGLAHRHELHLLVLTSDEQEKPRPELLDCCDAVETVFHADAGTASDFSLRPAERVCSLLSSRLPYRVWRLRSGAMLAAIARALERTPFDIVQTEFTTMAQYIDAFEGHPGSVFRAHDLSFLQYERRVHSADVLWRRLYHYVQWRRMLRYEPAACRRYRKVIVPSPVAKTHLLAISPDMDVNTVPFGITLPSMPASVESSDNKRLLFVGAMGRPLNVESVTYFFRRVWPRVRAEEPDAEFWVVGSHPPAHVRQLAQADPQVRVTGFVDDLVPYYAQTAVVVVPLLVGGGVVTKILDAMVMGKAVVATSAANEGVAAESGKGLVLADEPGDFAAQVVGLLRDPERRRQLGQEGRRFVEANFGWPHIIERLERIYGEMLQN